MVLMLGHEPVSIQHGLATKKHWCHVNKDIELEACTRTGVHAFHTVCSSVPCRFPVASRLGMHVARYRDGVRGPSSAVTRVGAHAQERAAGCDSCAAGARAHPKPCA